MQSKKLKFDFFSINIICKGALGIAGLLYSITVMASPNSVYLVNKDQNNDDRDIAIDYTICSDVLEKNPVCTQRNRLLVMHRYPEKIELKNESDILYVWQASTYDYNGHIENDYSKTIEDHDKPKLVISDCSAGNRQLLAFDTFGTGKIIGCQVINY